MYVLSMITSKKAAKKKKKKRKKRELAKNAFDVFHYHYLYFILNKDYKEIQIEPNERYNIRFTKLKLDILYLRVLC